MTAADATHGEPPTPGRPIFLDRFVAVFRATRREAAAWGQDAREGHLVQANEAE